MIVTQYTNIIYLSIYLVRIFVNQLWDPNVLRFIILYKKTEELKLELHKLFSVMLLNY